jgi:uncharacterized membrane protein YpjA
MRDKLPVFMVTLFSLEIAHRPDSPIAILFMPLSVTVHQTPKSAGLTIFELIEFYFWAVIFCQITFYIMFWISLSNITCTLLLRS